MTYEELVKNRKDSKLNIDGLINQSELDFDTGCYLDPWGKWYNSANPDILVIGQDWGNVKYYEKNNGLDNPSNPTCSNLIKLFSSIGFEIGSPLKPNTELKLHFANIIPFIRRGKMQGSLELILNQQTINVFALIFMKPLVELLQPKIVITLGLASTTALLNVFDIPTEKKNKLTEMVTGPAINLTDDIKLLPMFHCGASVINRNRNLELQKIDWQRVIKK
ncbi:hypothetical protein [Mucilaginibacter sp.]|uniref:hypothetical protein n=1 Tax=Mucilaginibacter sp. TaxID=1882438 RepID=UPI00283B3171|nr:hypothetical protein [Mucilaginibacter sp.]MDR3695598.1 hypothetical protein [Mucilaginibacter sp.]